jgi:hypothetical protein
MDNKDFKGFSYFISLIFGVIFILFIIALILKGVTKDLNQPIVYTAKNFDGTIRECAYLRISGTLKCDGKIINESK